jgi:hypothetical protein
MTFACIVFSTITYGQDKLPKTKEENIVEEKKNKDFVNTFFFVVTTMADSETHGLTQDGAQEAIWFASASYNNPKVTRVQTIKQVVMVVGLLAMFVAAIILRFVAPSLNSRVHLKYIIDERYTNCFDELTAGGFLADRDRSNDLCVFMQESYVSYYLIMTIMYGIGMLIAFWQLGRRRYLVDNMFMYQVDTYPALVRMSMDWGMAVVLCCVFGQTSVSDFILFGSTLTAWSICEFGLEVTNGGGDNKYVKGAKAMYGFKDEPEPPQPANVVTEDQLASKIYGKPRSGWHTFLHFGFRETPPPRLMKDNTLVVDKRAYEQVNTKGRSWFGLRSHAFMNAWVFFTVIVVTMVIFWWILRDVNADNISAYVHASAALFLASRVTQFLLGFGYYFLNRRGRNFGDKNTWSVLRSTVLLLELFLVPWIPVFVACAQGYHFIM